MSTHDHPSPENLVLFTDGGLSALEEHEITTHLDYCLDCALEVAVSAQLRDLQAENLISHPGPARREAGLRRLWELMPNNAASGPAPGSQAPAGLGPSTRSRSSEGRSGSKRWLT